MGLQWSGVLVSVYKCRQGPWADDARIGIARRKLLSKGRSGGPWMMGPAYQ